MGPTSCRRTTSQSAWHTLFAQFQNALILILLSATVVSGFLGHTLEAVVITVIVLFAVLLGFIQEHRAGRALEALRKMAAPTAHVLRDGEETAVPARDLVPGDVVLLRAGDRVPADARVTQAVNLAVDEAALTGESAAVEKTTARFDDAGASARRPQEHDLRRDARRARPRPGGGRRDRHVHRVRPHRPDGRDGGGRANPAAGEPRSTRSHARQSRPGRRGARGGHRPRCAAFPRSRCSCSASRWRSPSFPRRCRPS